MTEVTPGRRGYQAFADNLSWRNWDGTPMPPWERLPDKIRTAWEYQARVILTLSRRVARTDQLKMHFNKPDDIYTLCGMVRGGLLVTALQERVTCGRCQHSLRIRTADLSIRRA